MIYRTRNYFAIAFIIFMGIILGGLVGEILGSVPGLDFLKTGVQIGITEPLTINLMVLEFAVALVIRVNIMSIAGAWVGYLVQKKIIE